MRQHARRESISERARSTLGRRSTASGPEPMLIADSGQRGFKSCPEDRGAATVAVIELLLKGFAGARNTLHLELPWLIVELPAAS